MAKSQIYPLKSEFIKQIVSACDETLLSSVRTHPLQTFNKPGLNMFVLREDESGFGLSGCKKRKYASLIPWLINNGCQKVALIGGANSNHLASVLQLLNEKRIDTQIFFKKAYPVRMRGNRWLIDLLSHKAQINQIDTEDWDQAESWVRNQLGDEVFVVPEGGSCLPALAGSCTLFQSVYRSEIQQKVTYDHIFMDAGTGMMAGVMAFMLAKMEHPAQLHVVLIAGNESSWKQQLAKIAKWWVELFEEEAPRPVKANLLYPPTAKSFGAVNAGIRTEIRRLAQEEGVLTDPIYTAKLFMTVRQYVKEEHFFGNALIIHSGGGVGLLGHAPE